MPDTLQTALQPRQQLNYEIGKCVADLAKSGYRTRMQSCHSFLQSCLPSIAMGLSRYPSKSFRGNVVVARPRSQPEFRSSYQCSSLSAFVPPLRLVFDHALRWVTLCGSRAYAHLIVAPLLEFTVAAISFERTSKVSGRGPSSNHGIRRQYRISLGHGRGKIPKDIWNYDWG